LFLKGKRQDYFLALNQAVFHELKDLELSHKQSYMELFD